MTTFEFKFFCDAYMKGKCKKECQISDCEANCPIPETKQGICAEDGLLYPSECSLKCRNPDVKIRWKCSTPFSFKKCRNKCKRAKMDDFRDYDHNSHLKSYSHHMWDHHAHYEDRDCNKHHKGGCSGHDDHHKHRGGTRVVEKTLIAYPSYDPHNIYAQLNVNREKLNKVHDMLHENHAHNVHQDSMMGYQTSLIKKGLRKQDEDAARDSIQMSKLDKAYLQRLDLKNSIKKNKKILKNVKNGQSMIHANQHVIGEKLGHIGQGVHQVKHAVEMNGASLGHLHAKANYQLDHLSAQSEKLQKHMVDHHIHDQKLDALKHMSMEHEGRQAHLMGQVLKNQKKLNDLGEGQYNTQVMVAQHDHNVYDHSKRMNDFASQQAEFNRAVGHSLHKAADHMDAEKRHMNREKKHMHMQKKHMMHEAVHMADAEEHFQEGGQEHHHHYNVHHHNYHKHKHRHMLPATGHRDEEHMHMVGESKH